MVEKAREGETLKFVFREKDENNNYLPLNTYANITAYVYTNGDNIVKFSKITKTGYGNIVLDDSTTMHFWLSNADTKKLHKGFVSVEIMVQDASSSELPNGMRLIYQSRKCFELEPTEISTES